MAISSNQVHVPQTVGPLVNNDQRIAYVYCQCKQ